MVPVVTPLSVPVVLVVLIQNGCPLAFTVKVKVSPCFTLRVGLLPVALPEKVYALAPLFVTVYAYDTALLYKYVFSTPPVTVGFKENQLN